MTRRNTILGILLSAASLVAADELPKGETILDKYVEVTGGRAAYDKIKTEITSGTMTFAAMGLTGQMMAYRQIPDKQVVEVTLEGIGKIQEGVNGDLAWSMNAMQGPRLKEGEEKSMARLQARMGAEVNWRDVYKTAETTGTEAVDGNECYKIVVTPKEGKPMTRWYDKKTNLLVKTTLTSQSPMGEIQVESLLSDYRKEGDVIVPHKMINKAAGQEFTMTIEKVEINPSIPPEKFEPPAEVKALIKK